MQNAADSAALAAATTRSSTAAVYQQRSLRGGHCQYGYTSGSSNVTVTSSYPYTTGAGCSAAQPCYEVQISKTIPLYFAGIVGFPGNATLNGQKAETITATAISTSTASSSGSSPLCILALGAVTDAILLHGHPDSVLTGCDIASNDETRCTGSPIDGVLISYAYGGQNTCGSTNDTLTSTLPDPEKSLYTNIPTATAGNSTCSTLPACGSGCPPNSTASAYPQEGSHGFTNAVNPFTASGQTKIWCGDFTLGANMTLPANSTLVIENGQLDIGGNTINATNGATVIFTSNSNVSGLSSNAFQPNGSGGGVFYINAPTSGEWANFAFYQDPVNIPASYQPVGMTFNGGGSNPSFNINGLLYFPVSEVTISGSVNKNGTPSCMGWLVESLLINGNGSILDDTSICSSSGYTLTPGPPGTDIALVQ